MTDLILRDYQTADIQRLRNAYSHGMKAPIYQLATGGGKTIVFSHIVQSAAAKGRKIGVFVHRRELIKQASAKLDWCGVAHGIIAAGLDRDHDLPVQVLSIQSAQRRKLPDFDFIVIDEAHHARADTWHKLLASQPKAKLLGVTATPSRTDGKGLGVEAGGLFDAIVCGPTMADLVKAGHLAPSRVFIPAARINVAGVKKIAGDYNADELAERAKVVTGNAIAEYREKADGKTALAYCCTVKHAENVAQQFTDAGYRAACVHGETPKDERDTLIAALGTGAIDVLTSCDLISEGLDVPAVGAVILLRPTQSLILYLQQVGRGMRPAEGKDALVVLDHAGNSLTHGLPEEDRAWDLSGIEKRPAERVAGWTCKACGCLNPLSVDACQECGAARPVSVGRKPLAHVDGVLVEAQADPLARWKRMSWSQFKRKLRSDAEVRAFGMAKGYKPGWAFYYLKEQALRLEQGAG